MGKASMMARHLESSITNLKLKIKNSENRIKNAPETEEKEVTFQKPLIVKRDEAIQKLSALSHQRVLMKRACQSKNRSPASKTTSAKIPATPTALSIATNGNNDDTAIELAKYPPSSSAEPTNSNSNNNGIDPTVENGVGNHHANSFHPADIIDYQGLLQKASNENEALASSSYDDPEIENVLIPHGTTWK